MAVQLYVAENQGRLPDTGHSATPWQTALGQYLGPNFIGKCPANPKAKAKVAYAWNDCLAGTAGEGMRASRCTTPSETFALAEKSDTYTLDHLHFADSRSTVTFNKFKRDVGVDRHGGAANYLFVDGHAEPVTIAEVKRRLDAANTAFLKP